MPSCAPPPPTVRHCRECPERLRLREAVSTLRSTTREVYFPSTLGVRRWMFDVQVVDRPARSLLPTNRRWQIPPPSSGSSRALRADARADDRLLPAETDRANGYRSGL